MWISPRLELLPFSGKVLPIGEAWEEDPVDFSVTVALFAADLLYLLLAAAGAWRARWRPGAAILVAYVAPADGPDHGGCRARSRATS